MNATQTGVRLARCAEALTCGHQAGAVEAGCGLGGLVPRRGLAGVLQVSVRTVDELVAAEEITPLRVRGLVRFYLPDVVRQLTAAAVARLEKLKGGL